MKVQMYWTWVESEAALIDSDGCTGVSGFFRQCCWEHDLAFWYAKDPRSAYRLYLEGIANYWDGADPIDFHPANDRFKKCHVQRTRWGNLSRLWAWWRWRGVERLSRGSWDAHRKREQQELGV